MDISWLSHIKSISLYMVGGFNHLEKYKSQWEGLSHISWKNVPNHQPEIKLYTAAYNFLRKDLSIAYGNLVPGGKKKLEGASKLQIGLCIFTNLTVDISITILGWPTYKPNGLPLVWLPMLLLKKHNYQQLSSAHKPCWLLIFILFNRGNHIT